MTTHPIRLPTLLLNGALSGFFAIAVTVRDILLAMRGCAGNAGREVEKAPLEDNLVVCMLDWSVIDMFASTT